MITYLLTVRISLVNVASVCCLCWTYCAWIQVKCISAPTRRRLAYQTVSRVVSLYFVSVCWFNLAHHPTVSSSTS